MRKKKYSRSNKNVKVRNATAKTYKGIKFRSKLELFTYRKLQEAGIKADYEKTTFVIQDGFEFDNNCIEPSSKGYGIKKSRKIRAITYTPDFIDPKNKWIIEVKGYANDVFPIKWKMFKKYLHEKGNEAVLFLPKNQKQVLDTIERIKNL